MTEVALASDTTPQVPQMIQQLLAKVGLAYRTVAESAEQDPAQRVQAVLLDDAVGALLALFPRDQLLDLARLAELTGRKLVAVKPERLERMLGKHDLHSLPALPPLTSSPCLYDERLLQQETLLLDSGTPGLLLEIASADFKPLLAKASAARFGEPLANIRPNLDRPDDDRAEITLAVQNFTARRIQQRLEETIEIPPLPETAQKIVKLRVDPDATVTTSPAWSRPIRRWPRRWSAGQLRLTTPRPARSARLRTPSSACWASTW